MELFPYRLALIQRERGVSWCKLVFCEAVVKELVVLPNMFLVVSLYFVQDSELILYVDFRRLVFRFS